MNEPDTSDRRLSYFGLQSEWGVTKHFGGLRATEQIAAITGIGPESRVLEIGCGTGLGACHLARTYGCRVTGIDLNPKMVEWSRRRAERKGLSERVEFQQADATRLPFDDASFDVTLCESVTAFVPDKTLALTEYARTVRTRGWVALNEGTWLAQPPEELAAFINRTMDGVQFLAEAEWRALLTDTGLESVGAQVERIDAFRQRRDEVAGLDRQDWIDRMKAVGKMIWAFAADSQYRAYMRTLFPSRAIFKDMFRYLGYGIYTGRKI